MIVLDDESDYASVNTREEEDPTVINESIRKILDSFAASSYVAFTATPFANIFIDHENDNDLFPRDFIYALETPTNYFGSERTFGTADGRTSDVVVAIDDAEEIFPFKHKSSLDVYELPFSLRRALIAFFIANSIRDLRKDRKPRSMLVNVSRFKNVQKQVFDLVENEILDLKNAVELYAEAYGRGRENSVIDEFRSVFREIFGGCPENWESVLMALPSAVRDIRPRLYNSDRNKSIALGEQAREAPNRMVAVGGDVLSRGVTLDGLTISYFFRKAGASDTMLQMARWFGYRPGYDDLCRVWMDESVADDFVFVASSVAELRSDLREMMARNYTPQDFGLAVRKHPGSLLVTARNKMRSAEERPRQISLAGRNIEITRLIDDQDVSAQNYEAFISLLSDIRSCGAVEEQTRRRNPIWRGIPQKVIAEFLDKYQAHSSQMAFTGGSMSRFVGSTRSRRLRSWDVTVIGGRGAEETHGGVTFRTAERAMEQRESYLRISGRSSRLAGKDDLSNLFASSDDEPANATSEDAYYAHIPRPALLVYPLRRKSKSGGDLASSIDVAIKVAFPGSSIEFNDEEDVTYVVNSVAIRSWFANFEDPSLAGDDYDDLES
ncbi:Z1 domain-containing protein [Tsukamurella sp. PLM1]|uniref:Z1 domain-containing protein n=1 Tax=Tsukamurella sp. PLM1 TaxID=2929795 RepID=UPI0020BE14AF|nr:Z1 domain-containing protein [Tsukamurella sp. PLM1]